MINKTIKNISALLALIFIIYAFFSIKKCTRNYDAKSVSIVQIDTVEVVSFDTVWLEKKVYLPAQTVFIPDTVYLIDTVEVFEYSGVHKDSTIEIGYTAKSSGKLLGLKLDYSLLKPLTITKTIDKTVTKTETIERINRGLYLGAALGNNFKDAAPTMSVSLMFVAKKDYTLNYNYDIFNNTHFVGFSKKLF